MSGVVDHVVDITTISREKALEEAEALAIARAIDNGALAETVEIVERSESQLAYLKGGATRVQVKAVGDLAVGEEKINTVLVHAVHELKLFLVSLYLLSYFFPRTCGRLYKLSSTFCVGISSLFQRHNSEWKVLSLFSVKRA